ncbi:Ig-like domain-containing protein [Escherichia coli]|nr:Ig-like domain-containing protein [Escherichia coli]
MLPIPLLKLGRHFLDTRGGIKELAVLSYPQDNSDGTSTTTAYVNSLAILFDDGQLNITGFNRFGECRTGDLDTINYPNEAAWNVDHVWRADRAFVIRTFDNKFFYIGCTAGLIGSEAAGGNDVCVREWTPLPEQIVTGLHLDTHPERLVEVMGGVNNTVWVIAAPEADGMLHLYGSGNNTYGSLHVDKNQHATPVKIGETSESPETGPWKNPRINCEVHDNSVIFGGPNGFWIAGYDFLRNNSKNTLVYPAEHVTLDQFKGIPGDETWKGFMCGPNGAIIATERMHKPDDQQLVNVFYGQDVWGDDTWRSLNITYTHEVIMARGYGTSGIFFNNGTKQYRGFSRNLCNDIGAQSANNNPRANFIHYRALATAKFVEQTEPVSWTESVYFQGIHREGFLGTFCVVNGKLWWSGIPRGNFAGSNNLFGGQLNSQGFTEIPETWYKNVPVDSWGVEEIFLVNGWGSSRPVSTIYCGDEVKMRLKPQPVGATWFVDKVELVDFNGNVITDPNYKFSINKLTGGVQDIVITQQNNNFGRRGLYSVKITYHDKHGTGRVHTTRTINWNIVVPEYPSDGKWYTAGLKRQFKVNDTVYLGLNGAQPQVEGDTAYSVRLYRMDAGSKKYDVTQEIYDQRREMYDHIVKTQAVWEFNPNGKGGKMLQANEQNGTSLTVHEHENPWPDPGKPAPGARTLKVVSYNEGFFGIRWEGTVKYYNGATQNQGYTFGGGSAANSLKITRTPHGVSVDNIDVVRNQYGDVNVKVTIGEHKGGEQILLYAYNRDPRTDKTFTNAQWSYRIAAPAEGINEFYFGIKRDICKKYGISEWIGIVVKDERVPWEDQEARWFIGIPTRSDKYVNEYIVCLGGTNMNMCWNEDANKYSDYDYMRDYSCNQWFDQSTGYPPRQTRVNPAIFTDTQVFLTKQANEVQTFKNKYDPNKWMYNCYGAFFWGPGELPNGGSCFAEATYTSDGIMGQVKRFEMVEGPETLGAAVDPYLVFGTQRANMDGNPATMAIPVSNGYRRVVMIIKCDLIGKQVKGENGQMHTFETALHYQFSDSPFSGDKRISDTDAQRCKKVLLGAGWWWYEFDLTDKLTDTSKTITGLRLDLGENMHKDVVKGTYGSPVVFLKYVSFEHPEDVVYGPKLKLFGNWISSDRVGKGNKIRGVVVDAGTEDMLVNAVWPELPNTQWDNSAKSINWFNFHRAMWTTNCYVWREINDQALDFEGRRRMAPICWITLQRCYDHGYEIGGRQWQTMRQRVIDHFADKAGGGIYSTNTNRCIHLNGSSAYKKEGYGGSMIEWGNIKDSRVLLGQQVAAAIGPRLVQSAKPAWMDIPAWSSSSPGSASINPNTGDLEVSWEDMKQHGGWDKTGYQVQWWSSNGSLITDEFVTDNLYTMSPSKVQEMFGRWDPPTVTMSMSCKDNKTGALGPRVARSFSVNWRVPVERTSWLPMQDTRKLLTSACQFDVGIDIVPAIAEKTLVSSVFSVSSNSLARVKMSDSRHATISCTDQVGSFTVKSNVVDCNNQNFMLTTANYDLGTLAYSARITEQSPTLEGGGVGNLITTPVWKANEWVVFDLEVDHSKDNGWNWTKNCLDLLMGGPSSITDSHDSSNPAAFQVGKTHPDTGEQLPGRKYALVCISNGKADIVFRGRHTCTGTYDFQKTYSLKAGNLVDEVGPLYNPGNGIGIVGGWLQMQEPSITPSNVPGIIKKWKSNNETVATVDPKTGKVTFKAPGNVEITFMVIDDAETKRSTTSFTVKQMTPQWFIWEGNPLDGAYPRPSGTSNMRVFTGPVMDNPTTTTNPTFFGAYIPEIIGLPRNQIQLLFGTGVDGLATFGYSDNIDAARSSGWIGFKFQWNPGGRTLGLASIGVMLPGNQQYHLEAYTNFPS